ncbi:MAG: type I CRISPR-associated protein Cas7 [Bacteroidales bacterium]|jgi:CRISPR-associated protein Csh2|nr:type I CRISPR-associated protein Cas7 [Bacteroidales bacterium]
MEFKNRVFGCAIVKAINSNYNADFSGQPRTLPDGTVYATDKAYKYTIKNFIKCVFEKEKVLYFKKYKENNGIFTPFDLVEAYENMFQSKVKDDNSQSIAMNLLTCIDVRLFGATFAPKGDGTKSKNISIHGPVQVNHGINIWHEGNIYSEQIMSPFRNPGKEGDKEKGASTLGSQSKLQEGHYLHHFSINPGNLSEIKTLAGEEAQAVSPNDIVKLKAAMRQGASFYDSASKAGTDNEILFWVQLNNDSKLILPTFTDLVKAQPEKQEGRTVFDFEKVSQLISAYGSEIETIELYINGQSATAINLPEGCTTLPLFGNKVDTI